MHSDFTVLPSEMALVGILQGSCIDVFGWRATIASETWKLPTVGILVTGYHRNVREEENPKYYARVLSMGSCLVFMKSIPPAVTAGAPVETTADRVRLALMTHACECRFGVRDCMPIVVLPYGHFDVSEAILPALAITYKEALDHESVPESVRSQGPVLFWMDVTPVSGPEAQTEVVISTTNGGAQVRGVVDEDVRVNRLTYVNVNGEVQVWRPNQNAVTSAEQ